MSDYQAPTPDPYSSAGFDPRAAPQRFDPQTGRPLETVPRFDPYTGKPLVDAPRFDPYTGQRLRFHSTRFIARRPSWWWISVQVIWFGLLGLVAVANSFDASKSRTNLWLGAVMIWVVGAVAFAVISYAYRRVRRYP